MVTYFVSNVAPRQESALILPRMFPEQHDGSGSQTVANDASGVASAGSAVEQTTVSGRGDGLPLPSFDLWK